MNEFVPHSSFATSLTPGALLAAAPPVSLASPIFFGVPACSAFKVADNGVQFFGDYSARETITAEVYNSSRNFKFGLGNSKMHVWGGNRGGAGGGGRGGRRRRKWEEGEGEEDCQVLSSKTRLVL